MSFMPLPEIKDLPCMNLFHSQLCSGFGAPTFCPSCGETWKHHNKPTTELPLARNED